jgi:glycosyltransferase involved in cell wall biosynthesis
MDRVWVLSDDDHSWLQSRGVQHGRRQPGYGFGCRTGQFDPRHFGAEHRQQLRSQLGIDGEAPVLAFIGRQVSFKGFGCVIRGYRQLLNLSDRKLAPSLLLIGVEDPLHDSGLSLAELNWARKCPTIHWLGWQEAVAPYLAITDILLFPSEREGMPVNIMEALGMGIPVITCNTRGCRDLVRHGENGFLIAGQNPKALTRAIQQLITNPAVRQQMGRQALAKREAYDRGRYVAWQLNAYEQIYSKALGPN